MERKLRRSIRFSYKESQNKNESIKQDFSISHKCSDHSDSEDSGCQKVGNMNVQKAKKLKPDSNGLSAYELQIQSNVAERMKFLHDLDIFSAKKSFQEAVKAEKPKVKSPLSRSIKKKVVQSLERRRSQRLQNLQASDYVPVKHYEAEENIVVRPPPGPANMQTYYKLGDKENSETFLSTLRKSTVSNEKPQRPKPIWNRDDHQIKKMMASLRCGDDSVLKVVPSRIYSLKMHPSSDKTLAFVGGKQGELGIWDIDCKDIDNAVFYYNIHSSPINCLTFDTGNSGSMYTTSYDGSVRKFDIQTSQLEQIYSCEDDFFISWHAQQDENNLLIAGSYGFIDHVDLRSSKKIARFAKLHDNKSVRVVTANPVQKHLFATAGTDRCVCLWDIRNNCKKPLSKNSNYSRLISGLEYSPVSGKYLLTTCFNNFLYISGTEADEEKLLVIKKIPHNNNTGRWLTTFKATWLPGSEKHFVVGSMEHPRRIEVWNTEGSLVHSLFGDALQSVSSINAVHPLRNILVGGNSSGRVHVFSCDL